MDKVKFLIPQEFFFYTVIEVCQSQKNWEIPLHGHVGFNMSIFWVYSLISE